MGEEFGHYQEVAQQGSSQEVFQPPSPLLVFQFHLIFPKTEPGSQWAGVQLMQPMEVILPGPKAGESLCLAGQLNVYGLLPKSN